MKYTLDGINIRIDTEKENIVEIKDLPSKMTQRKKKSKISEQRMSNLLFNLKLPNKHAIGFLGEERNDGTEKMFEKVMPRIFLI